MPAPAPFPDPETVRHTLIDDAQGLATGIVMASFGISLLTHMGLITGQTAGLAVILAYLTGWSFGTWFFVVNLPFWWLAWTRMGPIFTAKSVGAVTCLSLATDLMPRWISFDAVSPVFGTILFGMLTGYGLLAVIRHGGSLGGMGVLAIWLQDATGFRAGCVQLIFDILLFVVAAFLFPAQTVLYSLMGAAVLNGFIACNHRRDRYIAR